jgi:hypothetical protein
MNSASGGLRPTVGLRRPRKPFASAGPTPGAQRLERPISIGAEPSAGGRHAPTGKILRVGGADVWRVSALEGRFQSAQSLRLTVGLRRPGKPFASAGPTLGAQRLKRPISIGAEPSADGWPARRMNSASRGLRPAVGMRRPEKASLRRRRPTPGAQRLGRPISIGTKAFGRRSACRMNSASGGLRPMVGLRRPGKRSLRRRRPTPGASAPEKADFNRRRAFGRRSACVPNEFGLRRPTADGRPAPTGKAFFASAEADAWRVSALRGRFQSAQSLRPTVGLRRPKNILLAP